MNDKTKISETASPAGRKSASPAYTGSIAAVRIAIDPKTSEETISARGDKPAATRYAQRAVVIGTPTNIPISIKTYDREKVLQGGLYCLTNEALQVNQYGGLELARYGSLYHRLGDLTDEHRRLLEPEQTNLEDFT